jgi:predicted dehydrogenase
MRVAVVGIGKMGLLHAGIMNAMDGVELCGICDSSKFLLGFAKSLKNVSTHDDFKKMLDEAKPDAVVITTPVHLHVPMAMECVERGIAFFLEKPLSIKSSDADALVEAVEKKNIATMVGYMMRYVETFQKAKEIIDSGVLGEVINFNSAIYVAQLFKTGKGWRYNKNESGGGVVIGQATHLIDLLKWYFDEVEYVSAHTKNWYSQEVEDFAHAHFEFANGVSGWMDSSWSVRHHRLLEITIQVNAANGNLVVNDDQVKMYLDLDFNGHHAGWTIFNRPDLFEGVEFDVGGPQYTKQDKDFIEAIRSGKEIESDIKNAHEVQQIVDAIYSSAEKRGRPKELRF